MSAIWRKWLAATPIGARSGMQEMGGSSGASKADELFRALLVIACIVPGALTIPCLWVDRWPPFMAGYSDFIAFYTGGALVGTAGLYSEAANSAFNLRTAGFTFQGTVFIRLPFYAALFWPFAQLPYLAAYSIYQTINVAAVGCYIRRFCGSRLLKASVALFLPFTCLVLIGQDVCLLLLTFSFGLVMFRSGRDRLGGFLVSVCCLKFHLFILMPLTLLVHRKWSVITGAAAGVTLWLGLSTLVAGPGWFRVYLNAILNPVVTPHPERMPNIVGQLSGPWVWIAAALALAVFVYAIFTASFEGAYVLTVAGGLLLNTHGYVHDYVLILPALIMAIAYRRVRWVALFLLTPFPYALLYLGYGVPLIAAVTALALLWPSRTGGCMIRDMFQTLERVSGRRRAATA